MKIGFSIDDQQELSQSDELRIVRLADELGYDSAWTPAHADAAAFAACRRIAIAEPGGGGQRVAIHLRERPGFGLAFRLLLPAVHPVRLFSLSGMPTDMKTRRATVRPSSS